MTDPYQVLGVSRSASDEEIKKNSRGTAIVEVQEVQMVVQAMAVTIMAGIRAIVMQQGMIRHRCRQQQIISATTALPKH